MSDEMGFTSEDKNSVGIDSLNKGDYVIIHSVGRQYPGVFHSITDKGELFLSSFLSYKTNGRGEEPFIDEKGYIIFRDQINSFSFTTEEEINEMVAQGIGPSKDIGKVVSVSTGSIRLYGCLNKVYRQSVELLPFLSSRLNKDCQRMAYIETERCAEPFLKGSLILPVDDTLEFLCKNYQKSLDHDAMLDEIDRIQSQRKLEKLKEN